MLNTIHKLLILGSGPAGYTAAIYAARANLSPVLLAGPNPGGQLMQTTDVENYPGFPDGILGPELMEKFQKQAKRFGAIIKSESVEEVDFKKSPFLIKTEKEEYLAQSVIIATGAEARWLGLTSEQRLRGHGVSACATCDGAFFKNKIVCVVGGGDSAIEESLFLTKSASQVILIHRRDELKASKIMQDRAKTNPKISFQWNQEIIEVLGEMIVSGVKTKNIQTNEEKIIECQGLFVAIGHAPNTKLFKGVLEIDSKGYLKLFDETKTKIPGIFIAGDVFDWHYRQAITAAGSGCKAAIDAEKFLEEMYH